MSVMSDMLADMLKKALPPEVMEMLTPENIKALGEKVNAFLMDHKEQIDRIEENQNLGMTMLNSRMTDFFDELSIIKGHMACNKMLIEETENAPSNDSNTGNGSAKPRNNRRGKPDSNV